MDCGAEGEVGVVVGWGVVYIGAVLHEEGVVYKDAVEELSLDSVGTFESPREGGGAVGEEVFDGVLWVECVEESLSVGVEFFLGFAFYDVAAGCQAVGCGVLGGSGFALGGFGG